jgi:hypothetical protein
MEIVDELLQKVTRCNYIILKDSDKRNPFCGSPKLALAIDLTCRSAQELLKNKHDNSIDLWISTRITEKQA